MPPYVTIVTSDFTPYQQRYKAKDSDSESGERTEMVTSKATGAVVSGAHLTSLSGEDVNRLGEAIRLSGLSDVSLDGRLSVVFVYPGMGVGDVYPEMAGCTSEVCAFIEESVVFEKHGIQVIGLSTEASEPPSGCLAIPFATGLIPQHGVGSPLDFVEKAERRYAVRASFVVGPDGTGEKITDIKDVVSHVRRCFRLAMDRRLARYRDAAMEYLSSGGNGIQPNVTLRGLLPNGADSVAIPRLDVTLELVAKLADGAIISQEAGYIRRINRLLVDHGRSELFPTVLAICDTEDPAWYLMEAVDPTKLDEIVFADQARTILSDTGKTAIESAVDKLIALYQLTMSPETPAVARYHYLERFLQLPQRDDFRSAFALLVGGDLESTLAKPVMVGEEYRCGSYREHMDFLMEYVDHLVQPFGVYLHGDAHLPNILLSTDGSDIRFIDPRVVWDGNDVGQPGFGDPLYDLGTLLHSLHVMSAILYAIDTGETADLVQVVEETDRISITPGVLCFDVSPVVTEFMVYVEENFPGELLGSHWRTRLHVNAANALVGWLKYSRAIQTGNAWWSVFAAALYHLEEGRRHIEGGST